jgi:hypothetical protein
MNRRQLFRQTFGIVGVAAAGSSSAAAREFPQNYDASKDLARAGWKPAFLDDHQNDTLIALSDAIIPETDTPGAKTALANRFIDDLLAAETREEQQSFLNSLSFVDGEAIRLYREPFVRLAPDVQVEFLSMLAYPHSLRTWGESVGSEDAGYRHFTNLKDWIARAFWSSEAGQKALGSDGSFPHGELAGCEHSGTSHSK